ncbi:proteinrelated to ser/arg-related nuclear matrix protein [Cordyceps javanica]|uniref:Proteinrelated to ser/arg-related nuclear matrix protein n=1 Tax=Cordyceps javanica TaxID=43265 RepID=A0A545WAK6_9HYPO|nr:proteinrelated to ser/arg-related nuclear matrix protein [Cordyceps javanica]TQW11021.1 proteinrelated to ser/arg-related nuclear matrix protein [Cordyceps javanica]
MGDPVNIQNLLQAGYFTTSRSRSKSPSHDRLDHDEDTRRVTRSHDDYDFESRYDRPRLTPSPIRLPPPPQHARTASRSKPAPPRPTVDDEDSILDKEHGYTKTIAPEEEAASRGDVDQAQTILEVHEFNPERRFVILDDEPPTAVSGDKSDSVEEKADSRLKPKETTKQEARSDESSQHHRRARSSDLSPPRPPPTGRRRSRQDLPVLETEFSDRRYAEHHRSRSAVNGPRPDYFNPSRSSRPYADQLLSPDITKQTSRGREAGYYGGEYRDRPRDKRYSRISPENSARRSETASEYRVPRRTNSTDRGSDRRSREYYQSSSREDASSRSVLPPSRESTRSSARTSREHSRSKDEYPKSSQPLPPSRMPVVVQEDSPLSVPRAPILERNDAVKPSGRSSTMPPEKIPTRTIPVPTHHTEKPVIRPAVTIDLSKESQNLVQSPLPYPEEDVFPVDPLLVSRAVDHAATGPIPPIHMPTLPPEPAAASPARQRPTYADGSQSTSPAPDPKEWKPPKFDPEKDGVKTERPVGTYRRYSENKNEAASDRLPNCPRMKPVAGKVDWLTLPGTDFNICPECYGQVFSNSEYRTHFRPVLRPTADAISCDFGSSPWYRIAWLLILKKNSTDLQVFHDIAAISAACRGYRCPGDRKTTREWYTIRDPYTKRPVPEFTVCYQCAKTIEAVLPTLSGIFIPRESRSNPFRSTCALHFTPDRTDFVLYFDSFETTAEKAEMSRKSPDLGYLAQKLERLSVHNACREDKPITDGYWHFMQFLPEFTVCADCFEDVVQPRLSDENIIARNFYIKPQKLSLATCQLYSPRMREAFKRACRRNDPKYLEGKVRERLDIEASIKSKLSKLDRDGPRDARTEKQIDSLVEEWKEWE